MTRRHSHLPPGKNVLVASFCQTPSSCRTYVICEWSLYRSDGANPGNFGYFDNYVESVQTQRWRIFRPVCGFTSVCVHFAFVTRRNRIYEEGHICRACRVTRISQISSKINDGHHLSKTKSILMRRF